MKAEDERFETGPGGRPLKGAMLEHASLPIERMPGLAAALENFIAEAPRSLAPLIAGASTEGALEPPRSTTLFQAIGDCAGLTAAIYAGEEPGARMLIALDDRIDALIVASIFGESVGPADKEREEEEPRVLTPIEAALVEEFARALGRAMEAAFAPVGGLSLVFERITKLTDATALGRRDMPAAAARFSLPMHGGACEGLVLMPQSLLLPMRKELERERPADVASADRRWSHSMERGLKQTRLPVTAILEEMPMTLGDIANLKVGALLPLQSGDFDFVRLECAGRGMFLCRLGQGEGRYRLELETAIGEPLEPATL